jgi:hypothetical protein
MYLRSLLTLLLCAVLLPVAGAGRQPVFSQTRQAGGAIGYAKSRVRRTRIMFPRMTRFSDARVMREVNRQIDEATKDFGCGGQGGKDAYYTVRSKVAYARDDIFSIYASAQYWCGGPYPTNDSNISQTYDLKTGKQIKFEELFNNYETDKREILRVIFADRIATSEKMAAAGKTGDDCEGEIYSLNNLESSSYAFNFSSAGLQVQPDWPHVVEACADIVTIPYSKLRKFAAPNGILARAAKKP